MRKFIFFLAVLVISCFVLPVYAVETYDSTREYPSGEQACYENNLYSTKWWATAGESPADVATAEFGWETPWQLTAIASAECAAGGNGSVTWSSSSAYIAGDEVLWNDASWQAQWWTQGNEPGTTGEYGVWQLSQNQTNAGVNQQPTVDAGENQNVEESSFVTLTGQGADTDGSISSYQWYQLSGTTVSLTGADKDSATFTAPSVSNAETLMFELTVTDNEGASASATVNINIGTVTVPGNGSVTWSSNSVYIAGDEVLWNDDSWQAQWWTQGNEPGTTGEYGVWQLSQNQTNAGVNQQPTVDAGVNQNVEESSLVTLTGQGADTDGSIISYQWLQLSGTTVSLTGADTDRATFMAPSVSNTETLIFELTVTDNESASASATVNINIGTVTVPGNIAKPFPQAITFASVNKPDHIDQTQLNNSVTSYYDYWKAEYVRASNGVTPGGGYYVFMQGTGGTGNEITTSEAHGYGMIIFALMAGYDSEAQTYYDGMYNMFDKHRSTINSNLMSWVIDISELTSKDSDSATDGDLDIAYSLLLAHKQWGSDGRINYLAEALTMINQGIKVSDVNQTTNRVMLGDWDTRQYSTRSSDWMTDHFHAFLNATNDSLWSDVVDEAYETASEIRSTYSAMTGLMPDFVVKNMAQPAPPYFLEADTDDDYSWNACRYPLRIAIDYAHYQDNRAWQSLTPINNWLQQVVGSDASAVVAGYQLDGTAIVNYSDMAFTAPMVAAATLSGSPTMQAFVNNGWDIMAVHEENYYGDSINLLSMLFISGNWWIPQ